MNSIILDTDPGIDDAIAMTVLIRHCKRRILFFLASYGNTSIENATTNSLKMLTLLNATDVPVLIGSNKPDNPYYVDASNIHGEDGFAGLDVDIKGEKAIKGDYLETVYEAIMAAQKVDYIVLGPLTNLASLMKRYPDVIDHIEKIVIMGGGFGLGNVTEIAEFNMHCDAKSADYVFENANNIALVPLNVTNNVFFSLPQIEVIGQIKSEIAPYIEKLLTENYHNCVKYGEAGSTMHDSVAVLYYVFPELFVTEKCGVIVDASAFYGETRKTQGRENVTLVVSADKDELLKKIIECTQESKTKI